MLVVDTERSEHGQQRRRDRSGRPLHCCCICLNVETWGPTWSCYSSLKEEDEGLPYPKFCSEACASKAGSECKNITPQMSAAAKAMEWRPPETVWREATSREKYNAAADQQQRRRREQEPQ